MDFTETDRCRSGVYCRRCRDLAHGRGWRTRIAARFTVPGASPDWECPHGRPWGYLPDYTGPSRGLGDTVAKILDRTGIGPLAKRAIKALTRRPCGCAARQARLNAAVPYKSRG